MNSFDRNFFSRYIPDGQELKGLVHEHVLVVLNKIILWTVLGALIPAFLYTQSEKIQELIPFFYIEGFLILVFIKIIYEVFNWYNDVWIITNQSVIDLDWALFKTDVSSLRFENIEGIEVEQDGILDKIFNKGTLVIHKIGEEVFAMEDAVIPYEAVDEIGKYIKERLDGNEKQDRLELILETLGGVVEEYLDKKGLKEKYDNPDYEEIENEKDDYTLDLRK